jgi:hypothetical protein
MQEKNDAFSGRRRKKAEFGSSIRGEILGGRLPFLKGRSEEVNMSNNLKSLQKGGMLSEAKHLLLRFQTLR